MLFIYDGSGLADEQETTKSIIEVSLTSGDKKIVYEVTGKGISITNVKCFGDKIFFTVREADSISDKAMSVHSRGLFSYSCSNDEIEEVSGQNINDYYVVDGTMYYFVTGEGLYKIDIGSDISQKYGSQQNNVICVVYLQMENTFILIIISTVIICGNYMAFQKTDI